jgi:hypothetical protein
LKVEPILEYVVTPPLVEALFVADGLCVNEKVPTPPAALDVLVCASKVALLP